MERIDDLEIRNYKIYQDTDRFCFGIDAVLLANFALRNISYNNNTILNIADLCSGTLPIPLIMYAKRKNGIKIDAYEYDEEQVLLSKKSILENKKVDLSIDEDIKIFNMDIKNIINQKNDYVDIYNKYDVVTCNPPYIKINSGEKNEKINMSISKHEMLITFEDICKIVSLILKSNKKFFMIHRTSRLSELIFILKKYKLEPKTIQFIHQKYNDISNLVLIESVKCGGEETKVLEPLVVFNDDNSLTEHVLSIYGKL